MLAAGLPAPDITRAHEKAKLLRHVVSIKRADIAEENRHAVGNCTALPRHPVRQGPKGAMEGRKAVAHPKLGQPSREDD